MSLVDERALGTSTFNKCCSILPFKNITYFLACYKLLQCPFIPLPSLFCSKKDPWKGGIGFGIHGQFVVCSKCVLQQYTILIKPLFFFLKMHLKYTTATILHILGLLFYTYKSKRFHTLSIWGSYYIFLVILPLHMQPPTTHWLLEYNVVDCFAVGLWFPMNIIYNMWINPQNAFKFIFVLKKSNDNFKLNIYKLNKA